MTSEETPARDLANLIVDRKGEEIDVEQRTVYLSTRAAAVWPQLQQEEVDLAHLPAPVAGGTVYSVERMAIEVQDVRCLKLNEEWPYGWQIVVSSVCRKVIEPTNANLPIVASDVMELITFISAIQLHPVTQMLINQPSNHRSSLLNHRPKGCLRLPRRQLHLSEEQ